MTLTVSCVFVDVGLRVVAEGHYEAIRNVSLHLLCQRFASDPRHQAAVILLGSSNTRNALADAARNGGGKGVDAGGAYANIEVIRPFAPICWSFLKKWRELILPGRHSGDIVDACIVATDMFEAHFGQQARNGRVNGSFFVITNSHRMQYDQDARCLRSHLNTLNIQVFQVVSGGAALPPTIKHPFFDRVLPLSDFSSMLSRWIPVRRKRQVTKCRINFELSPGVSLPVSIYVLAKAETIPAFKRRLRIRGLEKGTIEYVPLSVRRFFYRVTDPLCTPIPVPRRVVTGVSGGLSATTESWHEWNAVSEAGISYAFPFGKQLVSVSPFERDLHFGVKSEASLVLIGTLPISTVQRWWCIGCSELVVGSDKDSVSTTAVASLFWAATRLQCALLCRYSPRRNAVPRPVLLIPRTAASQDVSPGAAKTGSSFLDVQHAFCLVHIPFSDDVSVATFPLPPSPSMPEVQALGDLIESLILTKGSRIVTKVSHDAPASPETTCNTFGVALGSSAAGGALADHADFHCANSTLCEQLHPLCASPSAYSVPRSPPFSSELCATFLPMSSRAFEDAVDSVGIGTIPNPVLQRFLALLTRKIVESAEGAREPQLGNTYVSKEPEIPNPGNGLLMAVEELFAKPCINQAESPRKFGAKVPFCTTSGIEKRQACRQSSFQKLFPLVSAGPFKVAGPQNGIAAFSEEFMYTDKVLRLADVKAVPNHEVESSPSIELLKSKATQNDDTTKVITVPGLTECHVKVEDKSKKYVDTINPVRDFEEMLEDKDAAKKETAIFQMQQVILHLTKQAHSCDPSPTFLDSCTNPANCSTGNMPREGWGTRFLLKAFMCLEALRSGCSRERKGNAFNSFLLELSDRAKRDPGGGVGRLWRIVAKEQLPLISSDEDPFSDVSAGDAYSIFSEMHDPFVKLYVS